ncbi:unnamed protein product, partial [Allacma fusca]
TDITIMDDSQSFQKPTVGGHLAAKSLIDSERYDEAASVLSLLLEEARSNPSLSEEEFRETLNLQRHLSSIYEEQGDYEKATSLLIDLCKIQSNVPDDDDPGILKTKIKLISLLQKQGKLEEALDLGFQSLTGPNSEDRIQIQKQVAYLLVHLHRVPEAINQLEQVLEKEKEIFWNSSPEVISTQKTLASLLSSEGYFERTRQLLTELLESLRKSLGQDHLEVVGTLENIAAVLASQGRYREGLKSLEEVLGLREKIQSRNHPDTLSTLQSMSVIMSSLGDHERAANILNEVHSVR